MSTEVDKTRRRFLVVAGAVGGGLSLAGCQRLGGLAGKEDDGEGVSPAEDLMREHGALRRILLIHDELAARLEAGKDFPLDAIIRSMDIIRKFVENYHEKLEEDHLFPRLRKAGRLVDLVATLLEQHQAGRRLTDAVRGLATPDALKAPDGRKKLAEHLRLFGRMYRPHAAREDTVLFPAFHALVSGREYDRLGDAFEDQERALFGKDGFEGVVKEVAGLETMLGVYELAQFTPKI